MNLILETTKQILTQSISIMERQKTLETMITLLTNDRAIFDHVFKKKVSPTVNSESSESNIIFWKESNEVQWCFENLDSMIEEEDKTYLQMVAKK
ncbi:15830_t:CDS:2, partial [Cetraspora pellucida]